ncbi:MAG TPA: hypothetical protein VHZ29_03505 [Rhizomicrobium sp.]|nr:hypothetical protein [Rhizomicrobium sp.]
MQQSITQMARAADATALMARNLLRATRPLITMQGIYLERYDEEFERFECGDGSYVKTIHGTLVNQGKAKGFVKETWFEATLATVIGAPAQVATGDAIPGYHDIEPAQLHRPLWPFYYITLNDEFDRRELPFYVWGWIRYADVHGIVRRSGFAFEFFPVDDDPYSKGFFQPCERAYWYDVEEPAKET